MTLIYNDKEYKVLNTSVYMDILIGTQSLAEACEIVEELADMSSYTFDGVEYTNMVVTKRSIGISDNTVVNIKLRKKTEKEAMKEEITTLRKSLEELALTTNKTTTAKIQKILATKGVE